MKIFALSGFKQSGKDTAAEYLIKNHNFCKIAFADPLKDMVAVEYNIPREHCDDPKLKEAPLEQYPVIPKDDFTLNLSKWLYKEFRTTEGHMPSDYYIDNSGAFLGVIGRDIKQLYWTPRSLCILKGSTNRAVDSGYWVNRAIEYIKSEIEDPSCNNTGNWHEGVVISDCRYRNEIEQLKQAFGKNLVTIRINRFDSVNSTDPSERDLDNYKFDLVIDNKGTLEEFLVKVERFIK